MAKWEKTKVHTNNGEWYLSTRLLEDNRPYAIRYYNINQAYGRPSQYKVEAYEDLEKLASSLLAFTCEVSNNYGGYIESGVSSRNSCFFTYVANIYNCDDLLIMRLYATKTRTELEVNPYYYQFFQACDTLSLPIERV